jgi:regulator of protease activity HflC (stomatin/prohibitin superfamily)
MGAAAFIGLIIVLTLVLLVLALSVRLVQQYQRGVVFASAGLSDPSARPA